MKRAKAPGFQRMLHSRLPEVVNSERNSVHQCDRDDGGRGKGGNNLSEYRCRAICRRFRLPSLPPPSLEPWNPGPSSSLPLRNVFQHHIHTMDFGVFVHQIVEGYVTRFAPRNALKLILQGKLTFDEKFIVHCVVKTKLP